MIIRKPKIEDKQEIMKMFNEYIEYNSPMDGVIWSSETTYEKWIENNFKRETMDVAFLNIVPSIQYVTFDDFGFPLGFVNLRLKLNSSLEVNGGHLGGSLRPTERGKGYGALQLKLSIELAKFNKIENILLTCKESNIKSKSVIKSNGGIYIDTLNGMERYKIVNN